MIPGKYNKLWIGLVLGLLGPFLGFVTFYLITSTHQPFDAFVQMILNRSETHSGIISVSLLFNLVFFYLALRQEWYLTVRGVIMATFIYAPFVVLLKYVL